MASEDRQVLDLPIPGSGCGDIRLSADGSQLVAEYEYLSEGDDRNIVGRLSFSGVTAFRFRNEMHSLGFAEGSYDTLVEIIDSEWRRELLGIEPSGIWGSVENKKHYAVFFSSNGYLEVIAESFEELPSLEGPLESRDTTRSA